MEEITKDKRFAHIVKDPRFRKMPRKERKTKIDNRFKGMFTDNKFKIKCAVDKRGRPLKLSSNENLRRFYDISDESESGSDDDHAGDNIKEEQNEDDSYSENDSESKENSENDETESSSDSEIDEKMEKLNKTNEIKENKRKSKAKNKEKNKDDDVITTSIKKKTKRKEKVEEQDEEEEESDMEAAYEREQKKREKEEKNKVTKSKEKKGKKSRKENTDSDSSEGRHELLSKGDLDFARGEAELSSSSDEDDGEEGSEEDDEMVHNWADLDDNVAEVHEATRRLAICNLDWDRIGSKDIFTALNSFKPNNGLIKSVKVYLSEYGKERIAQEKSEGPKELKAIRLGDIEDERILEDNMMKESFTENLRRYQFNRLRYYYGVVECDSAGTADHIYKECDGNEYETSCTKFDLRFIPEEMEFDESDMRSECGEMPHGYVPDAFKNYAMAFSKAELTWDETDRNRQSLVSKQFIDNPEDMKDDDLKAYLADSSDEEVADYSKLIERQSDSGSDSDVGESEDKQINKYKRLILDLDTEKKDKMKGDVQMEISWEMGLKETTEELVKKKSQSSDKTLWDKHLEKKKEKKKEKRKEKKKKKEMEIESDEEEKDKEEIATFSDDDVPADLRDDPFFADGLGDTDMVDKKEKVKKKKKKDKKEPTKEEEEEKAALSLLMMDEEDNKKHFNLKKIMENDNAEGKKKKKKKRKNKEEEKVQEEDDFQLNVEDPRFSAVFESHHYNIDPSAPEYKKTKGSEALITEKLKRSADPEKRKRSNKDKSIDSGKKMKLDNSDSLKDHSLAQLVKSVKAKTKSFQSSKSQKDR